MAKGSKGMRSMAGGMKAVAQTPMPGPMMPGQPPAMKKALGKKSNKGKSGTATGFAGMRR